MGADINSTDGFGPALGGVDILAYAVIEDSTGDDLCDAFVTGCRSPGNA